MDLRDLDHFLSAVRAGSLSRAAAELGLTQPALSKSLRRLEIELGVPLLERGRFGVNPTRYGDALAARSNRIRAELAAVPRDIAQLRDDRDGVVVLGCGPTEATRLLPLAMQGLMQTNPGIRLSVLYGLNETLMPLVRQGEIEFAVSSVPSSASDPLLAHEALLTESAVVVAASDHPLAGRRVVRAQELLAYPWCLARRNELERRAFDDLFLDNGLKPPDARIETTSTVLMKSVLMMSDFLTFLPRELIHWEARQGMLTALPVHGLGWTRRMGITRRATGTLTPIADSVIDAMRHAAATLSAPLRTPRRRG